MKVGVLGSGPVARELAAGFLTHGYEVMVGTRTPAKLSDWAQQNARGRIGSFGDAAKYADVVVLAVKGTAAADALHASGARDRATLHPLVYPRLPPQRLGSCLQAIGLGC